MTAATAENQAPEPPATTEREARIGLHLTLHLATLFPAIREQLREPADLITATAQVLDQLALYDEAWRNHPAYPEDISKDPLNPVCRAVFLHPPGVDGLRHSFMIAPLSDLLSPRQMAWANRTLGELLCFAPVTPETPIHLTRVLSLSNSYLSSGLAYRSRMRLKELLPKHLHPLIGEARTAKSRPKHDFLKRSPELPLREQRANPPDWYKKSTKKQLWLEQGLTPEKRAQINVFMDPADFWDCATGGVAPEDVHLFLRQQTLIQIEPRRRSPKPREPKPPETAPPPPTLQQSLFQALGGIPES